MVTTFATIMSPPCPSRGPLWFLLHRFVSFLHSRRAADRLRHVPGAERSLIQHASARRSCETPRVDEVTRSCSAIGRWLRSCCTHQAFRRIRNTSEIPEVERSGGLKHRSGGSQDGVHA